MVREIKTIEEFKEVVDALSKICDKCDEEVKKEKERLDNQTNLIQNINNMKNLRFATAVAATVAALRSSPFSAYNITKELRKQVNDGSLSFIDKSPETIDGIGTYRVEHDEVRDIFHELIDNGVITGLEFRDTGTYLEYFETSPITPTPANNTCCQGTVTCAGQFVPTPTTTTVSVATPTATNNPLNQKIQDYIRGRVGQRVTMKEIQSRFKGVNKKCNEYGAIVAGLGFSVNTSGTPSTWYINA
jgi:hypothetical protein